MSNKACPTVPSFSAADQKQGPGRCGTITMFIGPMFARKTSSMLDAVRRYAYAGRDCILIKYEGDTRYEEGDIVTTHSDARQTNDARAQNKGAIRVVSARQLETIAASIKPEEKAIGVDEGQFFPDLVEWCTAWASAGHDVFVAALDGTHARKPFGGVLELIPYAEHVTKLSAVCMMCRDEYIPAAFTLRTSEEVEDIVIGAADKYQAACRRCFEHVRGPRQ
jgi:thymidine kinase